MALTIERTAVSSPDSASQGLPKIFYDAITDANRRASSSSFPVDLGVVKAVYSAHQQIIFDQLPGIIDSGKIPPLGEAQGHIHPEIRDFLAQRASEKQFGDARTSYHHTPRLSSNDYGRPPITYGVSTSLIVERGEDSGHPASMLSLNLSIDKTAFDSGNYYEYRYTPEGVEVLFLRLDGNKISTYTTSSTDLYGQSAVLSFRSLGTEGNAVLAAAYPFPQDLINLRGLDSIRGTNLPGKTMYLFLPGDPKSKVALTLDDHGRLAASSGVLSASLDGKKRKTTNFHVKQSEYFSDNLDYLRDFLSGSPSLDGLLSISSEYNQIQLDPSLMPPKNMTFSF